MHAAGGVHRRLKGAHGLDVMAAVIDEVKLTAVQTRWSNLRLDLAIHLLPGGPMTKRRSAGFDSGCWESFCYILLGKSAAILARWPQCHPGALCW
eukprot:symbB.v1.2.032487.t1/scaffold3905.1/size48494/2